MCAPSSALARRFGSDSSGTLSMIFGICVFVLFGAAGLAIDGLRAQRIATRAASALDSAALAAARAMSENESLSDADVREVALKVLAANTPNFSNQGASYSTPSITLDRDTGTVRIDTALTVNTLLGRVVNVNSIDFNKSSTVSFVLRKVELAMVLDVTGSMCDPNPAPCTTGPKIDALKESAAEVVDALIDPNNPNLSRIALVPYAATVNVSGYETIASGGDSLDGCVMERLFAADRDTDQPPGFPRNFAVNGQLNSGVTGRYRCPAASLQPLTNDKTLLTNTINGYQANFGTAGHIGLAWGWNTLSDKWTGVFTGNNAPGPYGNANIVKAVLLMTDGEFNTAYSGGPSAADQAAESVARTQALCAAMKANPHRIQIYSVAFQAPPAAETLLRNCASSSSHFYDANDHAQLKNAFKDVAKKLQQIRIAQ